jgi:tRNA G18 (ribose-2'-O)-methylase SpoU
VTVPPEFLQSIDDPRLAHYRNLKDRELARLGDRFIAESEFVVRRLLASDYPVESVLVAQRKAAAIEPVVRSDVPLFVLPDPALDQVIGYEFHTGVIAVGRRKPAPRLEAIVAASGARATLVICPDIINFENLGSLVRTASAFGADAVILGERCCDPFYRLSIRVSMGTVFRMPIFRSTRLLDDLVRLRTEFGYELAATVLAADAEPLPTARRGARLAILFGNEANGLSPADVAACDRRITLPMQRGTDSLNVAVAAAVFLYQLA